ncbi:MAG: hypothetical protein VB022_04305 [Rikenellaceae bacterium]|nr:hypothetical protein [Rikenellaceae bacterium]
MHNKLKLSLLNFIAILSFSFGYSQTIDSTNDSTDCSFIYDYIENGVKKVNVNGVIYNNAYYSNMTWSGVFSFIFWKDEKAFVSVNGNIMGPYEYVNKSFDTVIPVAITENGKFAFYIL